MDAIAVFKIDRLAPVSYMANIKGRGIKHIQTLAYRFADDNGLGYSHITYNKTRDDMPTIKARQSRPFYQETN
jgi:hypothetical protein